MTIQAPRPTRLAFDLFAKSLMLQIALLAVLGGCGETHKPKTISEISQLILDVKQGTENEKNIVTISIKADSIFSGGNTTKEVLAGLMSHFRAMQFDEVKIIMVGNLVDKYGKEFSEPILELTFQREEMAKINYQNVVGWDILNLSRPKRIGRLAANIVRQECAEENNAKYASEFCENALP